jgi:hypothetical protein
MSQKGTFCFVILGLQRGFATTVSFSVPDFFSEGIPFHDSSSLTQGFYIDKKRPNFQLSDDDSPFFPQLIWMKRPYLGFHLRKCTFGDDSGVHKGVSASWSFHGASTNIQSLSDLVLVNKFRKHCLFFDSIGAGDGSF